MPSCNGDHDECQEDENFTDSWYTQGLKSKLDKAAKDWEGYKQRVERKPFSVMTRTSEYKAFTLHSRFTTLDGAIAAATRLRIAGHRQIAIRKWNVATEEWSTVKFNTGEE